jgi:metal-responsive CopG/Arc/MetJ family transcriptional regulator
MGTVMGEDKDLRGERLQVMLTMEELKALDDFRFKRRMPSRAAAIREILRRGLSADGFKAAADGARSKHFGVMADDSGSD